MTILDHSYHISASSQSRIMRAALIHILYAPGGPLRKYKTWMRLFRLVSGIWLQNLKHQRMTVHFSIRNIMPMVNSRLVSGGRDMDCPFHLFGRSRIFVIFHAFTSIFLFSFLLLPSLPIPGPSASAYWSYAGECSFGICSSGASRSTSFNAPNRAGLYAGRKQTLVYPHTSSRHI